ncbi:aspartate kinase [Ruminococcus sp. HUN007]|uniref:aspartate kinase n=1 Tax=Ruminococcus sp. HUN007 TaxID=1514668 RepID=UPI0005D1D94C|nr:aspartate kinase [Ruminococcus sp. HUN007]
MGVKVVKFGGSSLADANQFRKVADIIKSDEKRKFVVPSAPGKRFREDTKVTDMLYSCYELVKSGKDIKDQFGKIRERYNGIISDLGLDLSLDKEFEEIEYCLKAKSGRDYAASRGEYLNGIILAAYLGYEFIDAAEVIYFDDNGSFMLDKTIEAVRERIKNVECAVIPGFYGITLNDTIKTFSRGGSDVTGSIIARAVRAEIYENWTDVSGFLIADPRIVEDPKVIKTITYKELRELSYMGATVLHEDAIFPVRTAGIPINIRNTNDPSAPGTMIVAEDNSEETSRNTITGIAGKKGFCAINIEKSMMNSEVGFVKKILDILYKNDLSFEHIPSGIDTMSIVLSAASLEGKEEAVLSQIRKEVDPDHLEIEHNIALLAVVGHGMYKTRGTAARVFAALSHARINIKMIDQGSSELNIIVGIGESDFEDAIRCIYSAFIDSAE